MTEQQKETTKSVSETFVDQGYNVYEKMRGAITARLEEAEEYSKVYEEARALANISDEEFAELSADLNFEIEAMKHTLGKLNDKKTRDWFVDLLSKGLTEEVTEEDLDILDRAFDIQDRIESKFGEALEALDFFVSKDFGKTAVVN